MFRSHLHEKWRAPWTRLAFGIAIAAPLASCSPGRPPAARTERALADDPYLPSQQAGGSPYCFDPASSALRSFVARGLAGGNFTMDTTALALDVRHMRGAMEKLYAGYPELLESTTFDVGAFFDDWEARVRSSGPIVDVEAGVIRPLIELRRHIRDQHLFVSGWSPVLTAAPALTFSEYQTPGRHDEVAIVGCDFGSIAPVPGTLRVARRLGANGLDDVTTFSAQSALPSVDVSCAGRRVHFTRRVSRAAHLDEREAPYESRSVGDASIIVVRALSGSPEIEAALSHIARDYDEHRKKNVIIFDFRGNGGGSDQSILDWIAKARRGPWQLPFVPIRLNAARSACTEWNYLVTKQLKLGVVDTAAGKAERDEFVAQSPLGGVRGAPSQLLGEATLESNGSSPFSGRIFVLVDHASASSAETAPAELRRALGATVVGERTAGFLEYGDVRPYLMPRTGVLWGMATARFYYSEPRDGVGLPVDVYLDDPLLGARVDDLVPLLESLPER